MVYPVGGKILSEYFGLEKALLDDDDLKSDPLTIAELASQRLGHEILQDTLRSVMSRADKFLNESFARSSAKVACLHHH